MVGDFIPETRQNLNSDSMRWSGRRGNQLQQRKEWVAPDLNRSPRPSSVMSHYSDPSYVIGNSSTQELERIARLFKFGNESEPRSPAELSANSHEYNPLTLRTTSIGSNVLHSTSQPQLPDFEGAPIELPTNEMSATENYLPTNYSTNRFDENIYFEELLRSNLDDLRAGPLASKNSQTEESNIGYRGKGKASAGSGEAEEGGFF